MRNPGFYATEDDDMNLYAVTPSGRAWRIDPNGSELAVEEIKPEGIPFNAEPAPEVRGDEAVGFEEALLAASGESVD